MFMNTHLAADIEKPYTVMDNHRVHSFCCWSAICTGRTTKTQINT